MSRRTVQAICVLVVSLTIVALTLTACAKQSPAAKSASDMSYAPAFGQDYLIAQEAVNARADDAKLLALQSTDFSMSGSSASWMFLFYSWQRSSAYTVFVADGQATVADVPDASMARSEYEAIPDTAGTVVYDADQAYQLAVDGLKGEDRLITCRAFLMTYVARDEDPTVSANKWYFSFNENQDVRDATVDKTESISEPRLLAVDATTGQVSEVSSY